MRNRNPIRCPRCAKDDQIRKVATVVREGTASRPSEYWTGGAFPTPYGPVTSRTDLARQLSMPRPPSAEGPGQDIGIGCVVWIVAGIILGIIGVAAVAVRPAVVVVSIIADLGIIVWIIVAIARYTDRKALVEEQARKWPAMQRIWNELYYCFRDDVVLRGDDPSKFAASSEMTAFLIRQVS